MREGFIVILFILYIKPITVVYRIGYSVNFYALNLGLVINSTFNSFLVLRPLHCVFLETIIRLIYLTKMVKYIYKL